MATNLFGYAELYGTVIPERLKYQSNYYPTVNYQSFLVKHDIRRASSEDIAYVKPKDFYTVNIETKYSPMIFTGLLSKGFEFTIDIEKIKDNNLKDKPLVATTVIKPPQYKFNKKQVIETSPLTDTWITRSEIIGTVEASRARSVDYTVNDNHNLAISEIFNYEIDETQQDIQIFEIEYSETIDNALELTGDIIIWDTLELVINDDVIVTTEGTTGYEFKESLTGNPVDNVTLELDATMLIKVVPKQIEITETINNMLKPISGSIATNKNHDITESIESNLSVISGAIING